MSKSSPPRKVSPLVDFTSNTPSPISRIEMSNGAAAEVIDRDRACPLLVEPVGERGRGRLVDDAQHLEAGDLAGILGRLALGVVEVGRDGDDRLVDGLAEDRPRPSPSSSCRMKAEICDGEYFLPSTSTQASPLRALHDLVGDEMHVLLDHRILEAAADQALDREEGVFGIGDRLALGGLADELFAARR